MKKILDHKGENHSYENMKDDDVSLRIHSHSIRKIIESRPPGITEWGISAICVIFLVVISVVMCLDYPYGGGESIFRHIFMQ